MATSLISNMCIGYTVQILTVLEVQGDGLQFSNIATPLSTEDHISIGWMLLMMFLDTVLYMSLYWLVITVIARIMIVKRYMYVRLFLQLLICSTVDRYIQILSVLIFVQYNYGVPNMS